ncbi:hypothetical protein [Pseudomonas fortuita]|uniref:hypothetical protein n=1 Tax=Pseudomonas fortuita TaxID=3233375 RepID=UPI003DA17632
MSAGTGLGYLIKTFGATKADITFNRLPKVIQVAREAIVRAGQAAADDRPDLLRLSP